MKQHPHDPAGIADLLLKVARAVVLKESEVVVEVEERDGAHHLRLRVAASDLAFFRRDGNLLARSIHRVLCSARLQAGHKITIHRIDAFDK